MDERNEDWQQPEKPPQAIEPPTFPADKTSEVSIPQPGPVDEVKPEGLPETSPVGEQEALVRQLLVTAEALKNDMQALHDAFDSKIRFDASKERVIDILHKDLQTYRDGLYFQLMRPLVFALIAMHDDLTGMLQYASAEETAEQRSERLHRNLASFQDSIESVLEQHGVNGFNEPGSQFVAQRQRVIKVEPTADPALDRQVSQHVRKGFEYEGKVIRPESVSAYKFSQPKE